MSLFFDRPEPKHYYRLFTAQKEYSCDYCYGRIRRGSEYIVKQPLKVHPSCFYERFAEVIPEHERALFERNV